jgi:hypothetical protein
MSFKGLSALLTFLICALALGHNAFAETKTSIAANLSAKPTTVLDGRASICLPQTVEIESDYRDNESAYAVLAEDREYRVIATIDELFLLSSGDLPGDARVINEQSGLKAKGYSIKSLPDGSEIVYCDYDNTDFNDGSLRPVKSAFVKMPDSTLLTASVIVNKKAYAGISNLQELADKVLGTFRPGAAKLDISSRKDTISVIRADGRSQKLEVAIPQGYALSYSDSVDFTVYRFHKLAAIGEDKTTMGIYTGWYPSFDDENVSFKHIDKILGKEIRWNYSEPNENNDPKFSYAQALLPFNEHPEYKGSYSYLHFFISYANDSDRRALQKIARSLEEVAG